MSPSAPIVYARIIIPPRNCKIRLFQSAIIIYVQAFLLLAIFLSNEYRCRLVFGQIKDLRISINMVIILIDICSE